MSTRPSVLSRFRLAGAAVILGVAALGALFFGLVNTHYLGLMISRTLGPYSDSLAHGGFASSDPDVWQAMAARHGVEILVEPADGDPVAYNEQGEEIPPYSPVQESQIQATRTGGDGTAVTFRWKVLSFQDSHLPLLAALLLMVTLVVGTTFWFLQRQLKPLTWLHSGVDAVGRGDFETRVPVVRHDEIGQVAQAFNAMAGRVGDMIRDRERLLADVSHELRSPLTRMKVALELLSPDEKRDSLARDVDEMETLIAVLLEREALRTRAGHLESEDVDLPALTGEVVKNFASQEPGVELSIRGDLTIHGDPALLKLLIQNLVDNAIKFSTSESQPVRVALQGEADQVTLRVIDDGIGIPQGSDESLFEPFVKLDPSRGHHAGYGIGLNLCQRIVQLHKGTIELRPHEPQGTEAIVALSRRPEGA